MCFYFLYNVRVDTIYQKVFYNSCLFLFLRHVIQNGFILFIMNKLFFWVKMWCFYIF